MKVVSNTSPLTNLAAINHFVILRRLYSEIHIAEAVWEELNAQGKRWPGRDEVEAASWVKRATVSNHNLVQALQRDLDRGEAQTIALALEQDAELVLLDEQEGRRSAQRLGLKTLGVVGVLLEAKRHQYVMTVRPLLDSLRTAAGFYLSEPLYQEVLKLTGEAEGG